MIKALVFDFDGVLVSSDGPRMKALQTIATRHGIEIEEGVRHSARGKTTLKVLQEIIPKDPDLVNAIHDELGSEYREHITKYVEPIEFTVHFIRNYQGALPIAIASMSSKQTIERLTKHFGIYEKIVHIIGKDEITHHKPDPEIYLKAAFDLNVLPEECLVFEDTSIGFQAAHNANMACCVVLNGENKREEFEGMKVYSFISNEQDLADVISKNLQYIA